MPSGAPKPMKPISSSGPWPWRRKSRRAGQPSAGNARTRHATAKPDVRAVPSGTTNIGGGARPSHGPRSNPSPNRARSQSPKERPSARKSGSTSISTHLSRHRYSPHHGHSGTSHAVTDSAQRPPQLSETSFGNCPLDSRLSVWASANNQKQ